MMQCAAIRPTRACKTAGRTAGIRPVAQQQRARWARCFLCLCTQRPDAKIKAAAAISIASMHLSETTARATSTWKSLTPTSAQQHDGPCRIRWMQPLPARSDALLVCGSIAPESSSAALACVKDQPGRSAHVQIQSGDASTARISPRNASASGPDEAVVLSCCCSICLRAATTSLASAIRRPTTISVNQSINARVYCC